MPNDRRLEPLQHCRGKFSFSAPADLEQWQQHASSVRRRVQVATGLWPMPDRPTPNAVVHGKVDRPQYTVERVYLESYPGHYVTGNLYRPQGQTKPCPAVLSPYGHWGGGRFQDLGEEGVRKQIEQGAERYERGGRHPLQARCVQLARMGCLVFQFDLEGYADSQQVSEDVAHRLKQPRPEFDGDSDWGFFSTQAELRLLHPLGLQTYNSLCALDWIASLPEVDTSRIGVTGGSGGATQTLMLCALDDRISAAFAAVMVSTDMQGGCPCENAICLRVGACNVDFAGLFAPKPMGMASANDWTKDFITDGYPQLQQVYELFGLRENVGLASLTQFKHNYNYVSRSHMYRWFNEHLGLQTGDRVVEQDFTPLSEAELTVWCEEHPPPPGGPAHERQLLRDMSTAAMKPLEELEPSDSDSWEEFRDVYAGAWEVLLAAKARAVNEVQFDRLQEVEHPQCRELRGVLKDGKVGSELPTVVLIPTNWNQQFVIWADGRGKQSLYSQNGGFADNIEDTLTAGFAVIGADLLYQGEFLPSGQAAPKRQRMAPDRELAAYTYGYNPSLLASRCHDLLSLVAMCKNWSDWPRKVHLFGVDGAGPWALATRALAGSDVTMAVVDTQGFRFAGLQDWRDVNFAPGAVKYGDLPALMALSAPHRLCVVGEQGKSPQLAKTAYSAAQASEQLVSLAIESSSRSTSLVHWFLRSQQ